MNMIKRICAVAIMLAMVLSSFVSFAAEGETAAAEAVPPSEAYTLTSALGAFNGIEIADPNTEMTGADFVNIMSNVLGYNASNLYSDISGNARVKCVEVVKAIVDLLGYGVFAERDGGYPIGYLTQGLSLKLLSDVNLTAGQAVTYSDFAKILSNTLQVDLLKMVSTGERKSYETHKGDNFLYKIMGMKKVEGQITGNNVTNFKTLEASPANVVSINYVPYKISEETFYINDLIGRYVIAYYKEYENQPVGELRQLVYAKTNDKYEAITIDSEDIVGFDVEKSVLSYNQDGGRADLNINIPLDAYVVYNGVLITTYDESTFDFSQGSVTVVSGPNGDNGTVIITDYRDYVVSGKDLNNFTIYNKIVDKAGLIDDESIVLDSTDPASCIYIKDTDGKPLTFDDIRVGDVLSIAENGKYANVIVARNVIKDFVVTGLTYKEERVDTNDDGKIDKNDLYPIDTISSADKTIEITDFFTNSVENIEISTNKGYVISLNAFGKASFIVNGKSTDISEGYLAKIVLPKGITTTLDFKIFRSDGVMVKPKSAKKITVFNSYGGFETCNSIQAYNKLSNYKGIISYRVNANGDIVDIMLPLSQVYNTLPDRMHKVEFKASVDYSYKETPKTFGGRIYLGNGTIIYSIPTDLEADNEFQIRPVSYLKNNIDYTKSALLYSKDEDSIVINNIVFENQTRDIEIRSHALVVLDVSKGVNKDGLNFKRVIGMLDGVKTVLDSFDEGVDQSAFDKAYDIPTKKIYSVKPGDIIRYSIVPSTQLVDSVQILFRADEVNPSSPNGQKGNLCGTSGSLMTVEKVGTNPYGANEQWVLQADPSRPTSAVFRIFYGWVYKKNSNIITVTTQDLSNEVYSTVEADHIIESYNANIYGKYTAVNLSDNKITAKQGSLDDISAYKDVGTSCSRVIVTGFWGEVTQLIVINGEIN